MAERYQPRTPTVIHEAFDDEVVIVNLDSGDYYSLSSAGSDCWNYLLSGYSVDEIVEALESKYEGDSDEIRSSVVNLIKDLADEKLILPQANSHTPAEGDANRTKSPDVKLPFAAPRLNRYSDMRDLLLIDPIHEVGEGGWPELKNDPEESEKD